MAPPLFPPLVTVRQSATVKMEIVQGVEWNDTVALVEGLAPATTALNLTGAWLRLDVMPAFGDHRRIASLDSRTGEIVMPADLTTGIVQFYRPGWATAGLPPGAWAHILTLGRDASIREIWRGSFVIHPGR